MGSVENPLVKPEAHVLGWELHLRRLLPVLMTLLPLLWLINPNLEFKAPDWQNHRWLIGYQAEHWRGHGTPAEALNTEFLVGMPYPVFYGFLFYPAAGLLAYLVGVDWALRLICLAVTALQFGLCLRLFARVSRDWWLGLLVAATVCWAT